MFSHVPMVTTFSQVVSPIVLKLIEISALVTFRIFENLFQKSLKFWYSRTSPYGHNIHGFYTMDTSLIWTLCSVPSVSVLERFDCTCILIFFVVV